MSSEGGSGEEARRLEILLRVGKEIASELDLERAVQLVTDAATELTGAAFGSFFYNVLNDAGESYMLYTLSGVPKEAFSKFPMPRNTKVFAPTFAGEGVVRSDDIQKDPRYGQNAPRKGMPEGHLPVHSYLAVPVVSRSGEVVGGLFFGHPEVGRFSAEHEKLAQGIAAHAAIAIDNARLYRAAQLEIERRKNLEVILRGDAAASEANASHREAETEQALTQLRNTERNFRLLVQSVTDYAIYMLDTEGTVVSWNAGAERIKGYKASEIVGRNYSEFFAADDRKAGIPMNALRTAREHGRFESEGWRLRKDGSRFWALAVLDAVRDEEGHLLGFAKITRDMTERREAQIQLERAQAQLAQSQKMEAIGHLTGGVAHDFNNLLMIVKGQVQLMRLRAKEPKDLRALDAIEQAAASGANLTRQLLTFARRQQLERVSIDLAERLSAMRELLASSVGGAIKLEVTVAPEVWPVEIDPSEFELALVNIAVNARDAMPSGGALSMRAENVSLDGQGVVALAGDFVALSLTDTGTGIPPEVLAKVFEPFFTTKEVGKGTGLGLSQVYGFARQSGGDVHIASETGQGTTVTLYLPRSHTATVPLVKSKPTSETIRGKGTILVVEDNPQVGDVSTMLLEQLGYNVVRADRPASAFDVLERNDDVVLVFSDIVMPGDMDGLALARELRERYQSLPVLLATGYSSAAERVGHEFPIIRKPYDYNALGVAVKVALSRNVRPLAAAAGARLR
ncbi:MAG: PAS domain S-box protein [Alphaproteobacteria bacterium]|nr:PAS domain S-box protein [Alphaproteobacteria bacterium]